MVMTGNRLRLWVTAICLTMLIVVGAGLTATGAPQRVELLYPAGNWRIAWEALAEAFNASQDEYVVVLKAQSSPSEFMVRTVSGAPPDLVHMHRSDTAHILNGLLEPIGGLIERDGFDLGQMFPIVLDVSYQSGAMAGGDLYDLPFAWGAVVFGYISTFFDEAGLQYPSNDWTWDDVESYASKLTLVQQSGFSILPQRFGLWFSAAGPWTWPPLVEGWGGMLYDERIFPKETLLHEPEAIAALEFMADLITVRRTVVPTDQLEAFSFKTGKSAMAELAPSHIGDVRESLGAMNLEWQLVAYPSGPVRQTTRLFTENLAIPRNARNVEGAWAFMKFVCGPEGQKILGTVTGIPVNIEAAASSFVDPNTPQHEELYLHASEYAHSFYFLVDQAAVQSMLEKEFGPVWNGRRSVQEAVEMVKPAIDAKLGLSTHFRTFS